jgi:hypothetical protein
MRGYRLPRWRICYQNPFKALWLGLAAFFCNNRALADGADCAGYGEIVIG